MIDAFKDFYILEDILKKYYGLYATITKSSMVPDSYNIAICCKGFRENFYAPSIKEVVDKALEFSRSSNCKISRFYYLFSIK